MVVRFLPVAAQAARVPERELGELAEVIELRSRLPQISPSGTRRGGEPETAGDATASGVARVKQETAAERTAEIEGAEAGRAGASITELRARVVAVESGVRLTGSVESQSSASQDAVRLLARRARSSGELRRELSALGHDSVEIEAVILDCEGSLYLDDLGLARVLCEGLRARKRASRSQVRLKLRERLLPDGIIEQVVGELDDEGEHELLREAATVRARKLGGLDRQTAERRLLGFLARRGWTGERATRVAREALDGAAARGTVRFR